MPGSIRLRHPKRDLVGTSWNNGVLAPVKCEKKISLGKNNGFGGSRSIFKGLAKKIKSDLYPRLIPQNSIFPSFHYSLSYLTANHPFGWTQSLILRAWILYLFEALR